MSLINLDLVINAVTGIANPLIKEKILRSETVIKLLQQFNLDPEHPPADFSGVYAYALVEYGVGKPKAFLELFRQEAIKQAFRKALDHNNPSILLSEVDVSDSWNETIKFWDVQSGNCFKTLDNRPYAGMNITGIKGLTLSEIATLKALGAVEE